MTDKSRDLAAMVDLTAAAYTAAQARMGALKRRETELRETLAALNSSKQSDPAGGQLTDPARRAGADILWQRWVDTRRTAINKELLNLLVAQSRARSALAKAFGRHEAIKRLRDETQQKARAEKLRRAERNGY